MTDFLRALRPYAVSINYIIILLCCWIADILGISPPF